MFLGLYTIQLSVHQTTMYLVVFGLTSKKFSRWSGEPAAIFLTSEPNVSSFLVATYFMMLSIQLYAFFSSSDGSPMMA